jgi:hypothetical protein
MKDGSVIREIDDVTHPDRVSFIHVDQTQMKSLEIVDEGGRVVYRTFNAPVRRCHLVTNHLTKAEVHRVESGEGANFELAICDEFDGNVKLYKGFGKDIKTTPIDWTPIDALRAKYPDAEKMRAARIAGTYGLTHEEVEKFRARKK